MPALIPRALEAELLGTPGIVLQPGSSVATSSPELLGLAEAFAADLAADGGPQLELAGGARAAVELRLVPALGFAVPAVRGLSPRGTEAGQEAYELRIGTEGIELIACAAEGIFRGLTSLRQLCSAGPLEAMVLRDAPRFAWRGLSLDVVRCFHPPATVERVVDLMALYKLNVLHLHLSDDQGWRMEVPGWPALTERGAAGAMGERPGGHYSRDELAALVAYAEARFITVVPEIDMPGHAGAAIAAYPQLAEAGVGSILDPEREGVMAFVADVVAAMAEVAPGPFIHLGGDEAFGMDPLAYARFVDEARAFARSHGKRPVLWQEGTRSSIGPDDVVQHWISVDPALETLLDTEDLGALAERMGLPLEFAAVVADMFKAGRGDLARALEAGAKVIVSPLSHLYLDRPYLEDSADQSQAQDRDRLGLKVYPRQSVEQAYAFDPALVLEDYPEAVAGVEAAMWCETVESASELEFMLLPRLAGVAEHAWSDPAELSWSEYAERLAPQARLWDARGWRAFRSSLVDWT